GTVATTTIYVRFAPATAGAKSGNVTNASTGATTQNVAVSGNAVPCPASLTVNSLLDVGDGNPGDGVCETASGNGVCTMRGAIQEADALTSCAGVISINFAIAGAGVQTITPVAPLPNITRPVFIDGYTQAGASMNTLATSDNAVLRIELNGTSAGAGANGLSLTSTATGSTVRGLVINRFTRGGISLNGVDSTTIAGNFIGTDPTGLIGLGNISSGVLGEFGTNPDNNLIGGTTPAARNIISGNGGNGIEFGFASGNVIRGNFIGLGADGATAIGNGGVGIDVDAATGGTLVGGDDAADGTTDGSVGTRNYISGNVGSGIFAGGALFGGVTIRGNYIGTDTTGTLARPNNGGIRTNLTNNSFIGGTTAGAGNLISGNTADGLRIENTNALTVKGNRIGTTADGVSALGNTSDGIEVFANGSNSIIGGIAAGEANIIAFNGEDGVHVDSGTNNSIRANSIHDNGTTMATLGIDLNSDGVTPNDAGDGDTGANNSQNYPIIPLATTSGGNIINGTLNSTPGQTFTIDFYSNPTCDTSGSGEGQNYLGSVTTGTTDGSGNVSFTFSPATLTIGQVVTATATDASGNTSEFSPCAPVTVLAYRSAASGNWNANSTWEQSSDGVNWSPATSTPDASSSIITVRSPHTVTVTASVNADELTIDGGGTVSVGSGVTFTIADGPGIDLTANGTIATASSLTINGQATVNGTFQINTGGSLSGNAPTYSNLSLLKYNTGGTYGRNGEWLPNATGGAGYPANVQLSNNTTLDLANGSTTQPFQMAGTLTIDAGSTMQLAGSTPLTAPLNVLGNVNINGTLTLSSLPGGDIRVGGNWTRNSTTGTFTNNGRAVTFNGAGTQTITLTPAASETFAYLLVDKSAGDLTLGSAPATSVLVNATVGDVLQILNVDGINLNGQSLTLQNNGGNLFVSGGTRSITGGGGNLSFTGSKTVTSAGGGTLVTDLSTNVVAQAAVNFGASLTTINGTLTIGGGGSVVNNAPTYGPASTLIYNCTCVFSRGAEWTG
ncbi:MAG: hypothetical protein WCD76_04505, partial [Pyrinomonadaceae bacterium]